VFRTDVPVFVCLFGKSKPAAARPKLYANRAALVQREVARLHTRVVKGFTRSGESERHGARNVLAISRAELSLPIEAAHLGGNLDGRVRDIEAFDTPDAALAILQRTPVSLAPDSDRRHTTHSCNHDAAWPLETSQHKVSASFLTATYRF
jgi:hypothetical protein